MSDENKTKDELLREIKSLQEIIGEFQTVDLMRKRSDKALADEKLKMQTIVEGMLEGVVLFDEKGELGLINPQGKWLMGFGFHEDVTTNLVNDRMKAIGIYESYQECREREDFVFKETMNLQGLTLRSSFIPIKNQGLGVSGTVLMLRDITIDKQIEMNKTEFVSIASHELRTPLAIIKEGINLVLDEIPGKINEGQSEILSLSKTNIERLSRIINNLLDISKIESGKREVKRELLDMVSVVKHVVSTFDILAKEKGLTLSIISSKEQINLYADQDGLIQVFTNLIGNAMKFTEKGQIEISLSDSESALECAVKDTGIGISKENLPKVFEKFRQFGQGPAFGEKGTGLGLSIAKAIVEMHKGKIWVESEIGKGTKFVFIIPKDLRKT